MKRVIKFLFTILFLILFNQSLFASDWEYWSKYNLSTKVTDRVNLKISPQFRFNEDFSNFYYHKTYIGPVFKMSEVTAVSILYAYKTSEKNNHWQDENIANLDVEFKLLDSFFNYRNRLEYNFTKDECLNRNKFKLQKNCKEIKGLTLFIWDELFYDFSSNDLNENRSAAGFSKKINKNLTFELSYMLKHKKSNNWYSTNVLETDIKFKF